LYKENEPKAKKRKTWHPVPSAHKKHGLPSSLLKNRAAAELAQRACSDILAENSLFLTPSSACSMGGVSQKIKRSIKSKKKKELVRFWL